MPLAQGDGEPGLITRLYRSRFVRFGIVGGTGVVVNYGFYVFFHEALGIYYLLASVLAIEMSLISNFVLNERWTFHDRKQTGRASYLKKLLAFNLSSGLVAWFTQTPTLFVLTH